MKQSIEDIYTIIDQLADPDHPNNVTIYRRLLQLKADCYTSYTFDQRHQACKALLDLLDAIRPEGRYEE